MAKPLTETPDEPETITIEFNKGMPVGLNGEEKTPVQFLTELNKIAGKHGIGVSDIIESRLVGMKIRGVYEAPAATTIYKAHHILETLCLDHEMLNLKQALKKNYADIIYNAQWFTQSREALDAFFVTTQKNVTGTVKLKLYKGNIVPQGVKSAASLYMSDFATFEEDEVYTQADAEGFINLFSLPAKIYGMVHKKKGGEGET